MVITRWVRRPENFYESPWLLFVLPPIAHSEMFGMVQLEAMARSRPVIATSLPIGVSWVNQDRVTGMLVRSKDVSALPSYSNPDSKPIPTARDG